MNEINSPDQSTSPDDGVKTEIESKSSIKRFAKGIASFIGAVLLVACCLLMSLSAGFNLDRAQGNELFFDKIICASPLLLVLAATVIVVARFIKRRKS